MKKTLISAFGFIFLMFIAVVLVAPSSVSWATEYTFTPIDVPGAKSTEVRGINDTGQIVGYYVDAVHFNCIHGFLFNSGDYTAFDFTNSEVTYANGINSTGHIAGKYQSGGETHGFLLSDGNFTIIDNPGAANRTEPQGINDAGQVVGLYVDKDNYSHGFLLSSGKFINIDFPNSLNPYANGINNVGQIVGVYANLEDSLSNPHGFLYYDGNFTPIDYPGADYTYCYGINDAGQVVGIYGYDNSHDIHGFLYDNGDFVTIDYPGATQTVLSAINDTGQIVGIVDSESFLATPVPDIITVAIDIKPWNKRNHINYKGHGILHVSILSTEDFDAQSQVDQDSLTFGVSGNEKSLAFCNRKKKDFNRDGSKKDLVCHFYTDKAGFKCGDTEGSLKGETLDGTSIEGKGWVRIINCK